MNRTVPPAGVDARDAVCPDQGRRGWAFLVLAEIGNFGVLRRHVGRPRADRLVNDLADRVAIALPRARLTAVAHDRLEIAFESDVRLDLDAALINAEAMFEAPIDVDGEAFDIALVLGAAAAAVDELDEVRLVEEAERALGDARRERRAIARDVSHATDTVDRITMARDLAAAIGTEQLMLLYQPKVNVRRQEVTSVEALIRWNHPERGLVLPGDFIPLAEETRDIGPMTLWTLERVIADQRIMAEHGHDLRIFINISGVLLSDSRFVRRACSMVQGSEAKIGFEITETAVIRDPESAIAHLKVFADIGITVAIDDYGAGLSSLAYLKRLPARELKIDKLFVTQLTSSNRDPLIVRSTIDLAHALEMEVVAEGVESQAALALLSVMGCDMVQGFLISRPIGLQALLGFLGEDRHLSPAAPPAFAKLGSVRKFG